MKSPFLVVALVLVSYVTYAQKTLTLEECYTLATKNYPLAKQISLLDQKSNYEIDALSKAKLPKVDLNAQATFQSDVIGQPATLPGVESLNKDQYRATLDVNQLLYSGGTIQANVQLRQAQTKTQQQQIALNLYQLKSRINQYFFTVLILQEKNILLLSKSQLLGLKIQEVKSGVKYGAILPASELILEAELIKINQQRIEIKYDKLKMLQNISEITFSQIDSETVLIQPSTILNNLEGQRPELAYYDLQNQQIESSKNVLSKATLPKINAFGQAGYGNPGLNMLDNSFQSFYIVGLKANWNVFDWGKIKKEKNALDIAKELVLSEKETFELNNKMELQQVTSEMNKIEEILQSDLELIQTREKIVKSADNQMKNGVITTSEYLTELTHLFESKNSLKTHQVELALARSNYQIIKGNK